MAPLSPQETFSLCSSPCQQSSASCCPGPEERQTHRPWSPQEGIHTWSIFGAVTKAQQHLNQGRLHARGGSSRSQDGAARPKVAAPCRSPVAARAFLLSEEEEREGQRGGSTRAPCGNMFSGTHGHESFLLLCWAEQAGTAEGTSPALRVTASTLSRALSACGTLALPENKNKKIRN